MLWNFIRGFLILTILSFAFFLFSFHIRIYWFHLKETSHGTINTYTLLQFVS